MRLGVKVKSSLHVQEPVRITIGIPSFNEETSIRNVLEAMEMQVTDNEHKIEEIIISDDSTDNTPKIVSDFAKDSGLNITLVHHNRRRGAASAWNEIFAAAKGDVIVLYDADVIPAEKTTLLLASKIREDVAICASNPLPVKQGGIAARASSFNASWLRRVRNHGLSQYTVMGRALSIRQDVARRITVPDIIAIDLYLQCKVLELGQRVDYCDDAVVWFKPASTMLDFASQVARAVEGHQQIKDYVEQFNINLSSYQMFSKGFRTAVDDPHGMMAIAIAYLALPVYKTKVAKHTRNHAWHVADSTKGISLKDVFAK
jgi:glycosyltransferase involved in cell wall biosynthesis